MRQLLLVAFASLFTANAAAAQEDTPAACREDAQGRVNYQACADVAPKEFFRRMGAEEWDKLNRARQ